MFFKFYFLTAVLSQITQFRGTCPDATILDFNVNKYKGAWYETSRYPFGPAAEGARCTIGTYGDRDGTSISVNNTNIVPDNDGLFALKYLTGKATQVDPQNKPNLLDVTFDRFEAAQNLLSRSYDFFKSLTSRNQGVRGNYLVLETDYETYALMGSCREVWYTSFYTVQFFWILTREPDFISNPNTADKYQELLSIAADKYGIKTDLLEESDNSNCTYDYSD